MAVEQDYIISVYRFDPDKDKKPYMQDYELNTKECKGQMLLDALHALKDKDTTLSFRRSCAEGVCGSDAMNVNGKNMLACITPLSTLSKHIKIRPLPGFPVVRDLVVDMTNFYKQFEKGQPYLQNSDPVPARERLQTPEERAKLDGLYECILCGCCSSACPSYWWNPGRFMGPAPLLWVARFLEDTRDNNEEGRLQLMEDAYNLFRCRSIMGCVDVCPKDLNPTTAIGKIRNRMLKEAV